MASLSLVRLMIIAIISYAEAVDFFSILEKGGISNEIKGKKLTELTMQEIALSIPYFSEKGEVSRMIDADNKLGLSALKCCQELLPLAMDNLNRSLTSDEEGGALRCRHHSADVRGRVRGSTLGDVRSRVQKTGVHH